MWHVIVGFWVGGLVTQSVGIAGIALYQTVVYGHFAYIHLFELSLGERVFCAAVPTVLAVLLWRKRPYVSVDAGLRAGGVAGDRAPARGEIKAKIVFAFCSPYAIFVFGVFNRC
jgi:hypothetical protein